MVHFTVEQIKEIMDNPLNVRNMSVIAHVDHGKTTLTDSLVTLAGIIAKEKAGEQRYTDTRQDEQDRCITIKSTGISLYHELGDYEMAVLKERKIPHVDNRFLINLIDSPGHVDFSSEVTSALRVTDGALVVVDCVSGVSVQTTTVMKQALLECVKPVLFQNKIDRLFTELANNSEEAYLRLRKTVEDINILCSMLTEDNVMVQATGDFSIKPETGNCGFGSGLHGWAFTLRTFAKMYHKRGFMPSFDVNMWQTKLWNDNYNKGSKWKTTQPDPSYARGFNKFVYEPIQKLFMCCDDAYCRSVDLISSKDSAEDQERKKEQVAAFDKLLTVVGCKCTDDDRKMDSRELFKKLMKTWLPAGETLLELIILYLPSPVQSQKYRASLLYEGSPEDPTCIDMKNCNPDGEVMLYISKMIPSIEKGRFLAYGRVFSGRVRTGQTVYVMGPKFVQGLSTGTTDRIKTKIQRVNLVMGKKIESIEDVPCGNLCAITGIDKYLIKTGTICTNEISCNMKQMKFSVSPVVRCSVAPKDDSKLPKLVDGLKKLAKSDPLVVVDHVEGCGYVLGCAGELHLEIILKDLTEDFAGIELLTSDPVVSYRESVFKTLGEPLVVLSKSPNKHNRIYCKALNLPEALCVDIDEGENDCCYNSDVKKRALYLATNYDIQKSDALKIWCYGPEGNNPNICLDGTKGVQYMNDIKEHVVTGFQMASKEGPLADESMRGVQISLHDATLHADTIHRGAGQICPAARRSILGAVLANSPCLLEPIFLVEMFCPASHSNGCYSVMGTRRGTVYEDDMIEGTSDKMLKAYLPVSESFGFTAALRSQTGGQAFPQCSFHHWDVIQSDPLEPGTQAYDVVSGIRKRKNLKPIPDGLDHYMDKL